MRKGLTDDPKVIQEILASTDVIWLAISDEVGPYSVPVNFAEKDGTLFIHSGKKGRKYAALMTGTPIAFSAATEMKRKHGDSACNFGYNFHSVMGQGTPRHLEDDEMMQALDAITIKFAGKQLPFNEKVLAATAVFAIDVETVTARIKE